MNYSSRDDYLKAEVLTASPQKLQLMLIQAAIRNVRQGHNALERNDKEAAKDPLAKAQAIVGQILAGLRSEHAPELTAKVAAIYIFVLRTLVEVMLDGEAAPLAGVLRILEEERETWTQMCAQLNEFPVEVDGLRTEGLPEFDLAEAKHQPTALKRMHQSPMAQPTHGRAIELDDTTPSTMPSGPLNLEA